MGSKFGDFFAFVGKAAISQATGRNIFVEEFQNRINAAEAAITGTSELGQQVRDSVSSTLTLLNEFIEGCNEQGIRFHRNFAVDESLEFLESIRKSFWTEVETSNNIFKNNGNYAELLDFTEKVLIPKAESYAKNCQMFIQNLRAPALLSESLDRIREIDEEIMFFIESEKAKSFDNFKEIKLQGNVIQKLIQHIDANIEILFEIFRPLEPYQSESWIDEFKSSLSKLQSEYKKYNLITSGSGSSAKQSSSNQSPADKIKALGELLELGLITKKEFETKKGQILENI